MTTMTDNKIKLFSRLHYGCVSDLVRCNGCDERMLVSYGMERCPCCGSEGTLTWLNPVDDSNECVADTEHYEIVDTEVKC